MGVDLETIFDIEPVEEQEKELELEEIKELTKINKIKTEIKELETFKTFLITGAILGYGASVYSALGMIWNNNDSLANLALAILGGGFGTITATYAIQATEEKRIKENDIEQIYRINPKLKKIKRLEK